MHQHVLNRTSPKGTSFRGVCSLCGKKEVTLAMMAHEECPNVRGLAFEQAFIETVLG